MFQGQGKLFVTWTNHFNPISNNAFTLYGYGLPYNDFPFLANLSQLA